MTRHSLKRHLEILSAVIPQLEVTKTVNRKAQYDQDIASGAIFHTFNLILDKMNYVLK